MQAFQPATPSGQTARRLTMALATCVLASCAAPAPGPGGPEYLVVGIDEKIFWNDQKQGKLDFAAPGNDRVLVLDIGRSPERPEIVASLPLMNSVFGPPTNVAVSPDQSIALVANGMDWQQEAGVWKPVPDNKLHVIDLTSSPPRLAGTVIVGRQPSGLAIDRSGAWGLVANRADNSISVLRISGNKVEVTDTLQMGEQVAHVAIVPGGKRAIAMKFPGHKVALLDVAGTKISDAKQDLPVGQWPYNAVVTPDGKLAVVANGGNSGISDGSADTLSVVDLEATPPRVIDHVLVGDGPEGIVVSPDGRYVVAMVHRGSNHANTEWYYHETGVMVAFRVDGKKLVRIAEVELGRFPEPAAFSRDSRYLYVGNLRDRSLSILRFDGDAVTKLPNDMKLPGQPVSMRGSTP